MSILKKTIISGSFALFAAGSVHAAVLTTPPLHADANQHFHCSIANIGTKPLQVTEVQIIDQNGAVESVSSAFVMAPGQIASGQNSSLAMAYCRFTIKGSVKTVRAGLSVLDSAGTYVVAYLPAT